MLIAADPVPPGAFFQEVSGDVTFERHLNQYHVIRLDISGLNECLPELVRKAGTQMVFVIDEWDAVMCQL